MKTAMQELIDKVEHAISYNVEGGLVEKYTWTELFDDMEKALEKEKEQIINDYINGKANGYDAINVGAEYNIIGEDYYNQTYNQIK
jgi:hypothetical protein